MAQFTTRVELHDADWNDYTQLHAQMKRQGFAQTITSSDGKIYELPPAEYDYSGDVDKADVLKKAKAAAGAVKTSYGILVTESDGRTWSGLKLLR